MNLFKLHKSKLEQNEFVHSLNLITTKPVLYVCNVDESSIIIGNIVPLEQNIDSSKFEKIFNMKMS